jgi:hypothetical protein
LGDTTRERGEKLLSFAAELGSTGRFHAIEGYSDRSVETSYRSLQESSLD